MLTTLFLHPSSALTPWFDGSWAERRTITIDNRLNPNILLNYQVKIDIMYSLTMNPDFSDLRFTSNDGTTLIPYWVESYSTSVSAVVWVRVPSLPASSTATIYMYYGNPQAISASSGSATFEFFDDFESLSLTGWTDRQLLPQTSADGTAAVHNDVLYYFGGYNDTARNILKINYAYNPNTNVWTRKADMPTARWGEVAVQYGGKIYVFGGQGDVAGQASYSLPNVNKYSGNPLTTIPEYGADGVVHPDVIYFPSGRDGYKYWMMYTPFPPQSKENPSIVRSNDGITWTDTGISNPIIAAGAPGSFNDLENPDPDFCYVADLNKWFMVWDPGDRATDSRKIALAYSSDGKTWTQYNGASINGNTNPVILSGDDAYGQPWERGGTVSKLSCPTLFYENGIFYLYYVEEASGNNRGAVGLATFRWNSTTNSIENLARNSGNPIINLPLDGEFKRGIGHLNVAKDPTGSDYYLYGVRQLQVLDSYELVLLTSPDRINWNYQGLALTTGSAQSWDNYHIYRSSPTVDQAGRIVLVNNKIELFYSGWIDNYVPHIGVAYISQPNVLGNPVATAVNTWGGDVELSEFQFLGSTGTYSGNITVYFSSVASSPDNKAIVGIYDQSLNKIAQSNARTGLSAGWQTFPLTGSFNLIHNSFYYLASHAPVGNNGGLKPGAIDQSGWKTRVYDGTMANSLSPLTGQEDSIYSIYCTYNGTSSSTIIPVSALPPASLHSNEVYNPSTDTWEVKTNVPDEISNQGLMGVLYGNEIHLFYKNYHYRYNPLTDSYTRKADVPTARTWGTCTVVGNKIYVIGGYSYDSPIGATNVNEVYDPSLDTWQTKSPLPLSLWGVTRENPVIDGKIYVTHGLDGSRFHATTFVYDPSTDLWSQKSSASHPRDGTASGIISGKLYVVGGRADFAGPYGLNFNEAYDPSLDIAAKWSVSDTSQVKNDASAKHQGNYGLLINDVKTASSEYAEHQLGGLSQLVVDVDWDMTNALGTNSLQPQGRIMLTNPSSPQYGSLYYYNDGGTARFKWYTGWFTTLQSGSWNSWYHITIVWAGSNSKVIINGNQYSVTAQVGADRIRLETSRTEASRSYFDLVRVRQYSAVEPTVSISQEESNAPQGTLLINTVPVSGTVYVNGVPEGTAPVSLPLNTGEYVIIFGDVAGYIAPPGQIATVTEGATTEITGVYTPLPLEEISGTVTDLASNLPIEGATVRANTYVTTTVADGTYVLAVGAGTYNVIASKPGYVTETKSGVVVNSEENTVADFALSLNLQSWTQTTVSDFNSGTKNNVDVVATIDDPSDGNIMLARPSGESVLFNDNFNDGVLESGWVVDKEATSQWLKIDLGSVYNIDTVKVYQSNFPNYFTKDYQVLLSSDNVVYATVASNTLLNSVNDVKTSSFAGTSARYVEILISSRYTPGISQGLNEVEVFQTGNPTVNIALNKVTTASSQWPSSNYAPRKATDGLKGTVVNSSPYPWLCADKAKASSDSVVTETNGALMITAPNNNYAHIERSLGLASDPEKLVATARINVPGDVGATWRPQIALYWASGDWCGIGVSNNKFITSVNVYSTRSEGYVAYDGASPNVYWYVRIVLNSTTIEFDKSTDGSSWTALRTIARPASYAGPPVLLIVGKGYGNGGYTQGGYTYPNADLDNSYTVSGSIGVSYIDDVTVTTVGGESSAQYLSYGSYTSTIYDANPLLSWQTISWTADLPLGTSLTLQTRTGNTPTPDASWSDWSAAYANSGATITSSNARYIQYRVTLETTNTEVSPTLCDLTIAYVKT